MTVGFDEAGRGPLAGPVVAGAVILPPDFPIEILNDSKKLSEKKRLAAEAVIKEKAMWGIGIVDHKKIDEINILQASLLAMKLAYEDLKRRYDSVTALRQTQGPYVIASEARQSITGITDGTFIPDVPFECRAEPKADAKYPCVMAASIIAKVCRDRIMLEYDKMKATLQLLADLSKGIESLRTEGGLTIEEAFEGLED